MVSFLAHWAFEMGGSGTWACLRGKCAHRHHRVAGDAALTGILTLVLLRVIG